jgi:hypothetical protein
MRQVMMRRRSRLAIVPMAVVLGGVVCGEAAAQDVEVKIQITPDVKIQITPETAREVRRIIDVAVGQDVGRRIGAEISAAIREVMSDLRRLADLDVEARQSRSQFKAEQIQRETKTFALGADGRLELENLSGDIKATAGTGRDVTVEIVRTSRGRTDADAKLGLSEVRVETQERGQRASLRTRYPDGQGRRPYSVSVTYTVSAPAGTAISIKTYSGDVAVSGIRGETAVTALSGDIVITDAGRITHLETLSGDITVTRADMDSPLEAETMGGDIVLADVKARRLEATALSGDVTVRNVSVQAARLHTMSGDVVWSGPLLASGRYELQTQSGDVEITLDGKTGFSFEGATWSGDIRSDLALKGSVQTGRIRQRTLRGTFGDGSAVVIATTFGGDIRLLRKQ